MADFETYFGETDDGGYYALLDLSIPSAWEPGASGEDVMDTLDDLIHYAEELRRAVRVLERAGGGVAVSTEYEDTLDVYFENRADAEEALRGLEGRDLMDFLVEHPDEYVAADEDAANLPGSDHDARLN